MQKPDPRVVSLLRSRSRNYGHLWMGTFDEYVYARARNALEVIQNRDRPEIYVVSFFVYDEEDNPRKPTLTVGFNTEFDVAAELARAELERDQIPALDDAEARWCYAYYGAHELTVMFDSRDPDGVKVRDHAILINGYGFPREDDLATAITTPWFVANAVFAARRLHDHGHIKPIFGRPIPVIVHELQYYDTIAMQNLAANPPGIADDFVEWVRRGVSPWEVEVDIP
jgi:hypothetical protein